MFKSIIDAVNRSKQRVLKWTLNLFGKEMAKKKKSKVEKVMHEFKEGKLHSGSKKGPEVKNRKQAVAIALSEARKKGEKVSPKLPKKKK